MSSPEDLLDAVVDRESFVAFVLALAEKREEAEYLEREDPVCYRFGGEKKWYNGDISSFLYTALDYLNETEFH
jgi:hypothetical protein